MNCPYCAEDVKDEAIVCRHCNRDLTFLQVFEKRVAALERALKDLQQPGGPVSMALQGSDSWIKHQRLARILVLIQGTFVTLVIYLFGLLYQHSAPHTSAWTTAMMLSAPVPLAVFLLFFSDLYHRAGEYLGIGLFEGIVMWFAAMARARILWPDPVLALARDRVDALLLYLATSGFLFLSIGLLRRTLRHRELTQQAQGEELTGGWEFAWKYVLPPVLTFILGVASLFAQTLATKAK